MKKFVLFLLVAVVVLCVMASTSLAGLLSEYTFDGNANNSVSGAPTARRSARRVTSPASSGRPSA